MTFKESTSSQLNPNMSDLGYGSTNILKNLGSFFFALIAIVVVIGLLFLMKFIVRKSALANKIYMAIH